MIKGVKSKVVSLEVGGNEGRNENVSPLTQPKKNMCQRKEGNFEEPPIIGGITEDILDRVI
jgi:hypothetical protein